MMGRIRDCRSDPDGRSQDHARPGRRGAMDHRNMRSLAVNDSFETPQNALLSVILGGPRVPSVLFWDWGLFVLTENHAECSVRTRESHDKGLLPLFNLKFNGGRPRLLKLGRVSRGCEWPASKDYRDSTGRARSHCARPLGGPGGRGHRAGYYLWHKASVQGDSDSTRARRPASESV
jgi:hypothetical protein